MFRKRSFWIILMLIVVAASGGGYFYFTNVATAETDEVVDEVQTAVARQGDIVVSATGAGTIVAATEIEVAFVNGGTVTELLVAVGQQVTAGDVLARLDDTDALEALANAELQLSQARMQVDGDATSAGVSFNEISIEQALINLETAEADLDALLDWEPDPAEIALAEANLASAQAQYNAARGQEAATGNNIQVSAINLEQVEAALVEAQAAYDVAFDPGREWELYIDDPSCLPGQEFPNCTGTPYSTRIRNERDAATSNLARAEDNLEIAQLQYNADIASASSSNSTAAEASTLNAEQALVAAQTGPSEDEITAAETAVRQANLSYQQALLNEETDQIALAQAELNLAASQDALDNTVLVAPVSGVVMAINYDVGETASSGAFLTLADLDQPLLEVYLDETDLNMVGMGYEVEVAFDALPDETFSGSVVQVDPQLINEGGVTAVRALVQLDEFAKPQTLPVGLNATVEVIGGRAENAVLVPVEALRELSPGQYALFVMENDEPAMRLVEVGIMDFSFAEIISGVSAGEEVTTGIVQTQ